MDDIAQQVTQALEQGDLSQAREVALKAYHDQGSSETFDRCLGILACKFKEAGLVEQALELLEKKCQPELEADPGDRAALKHWRKDLDNISWSMARRDPQHSSRAVLEPEDQPLGWRPQWSHRFPKEFPELEETFNLPAPIIARDMLIIFDGSGQGLIGLDLNSGAKQWESGILSANLDFSSTPVYIRPFLYLMVPGFVKRLSLQEAGTSLETIVESSPQVTPAPYTAPLAWGELLIFPCASHLLIYDRQKDRNNYYGVELKENEILRLPVIYGDRLFLFTNLARIFTWSPGRAEVTILKDLSSQEEITCSAPCAVDRLIYFELVTQEGKRRVGCYCPEEDFHLSWELTKDPKELCGREHAHLFFPPLATNAGVVMCSDVVPTLYKARLVEKQMEVLPLPVRSTPEAQEIDRISQIYSCTCNSLLLSKGYSGFSVINLLNGNAENEVFQAQRWDMISQPVIYGRKVLFVCRKGVACYEICRKGVACYEVV